MESKIVVNNDLITCENCNWSFFIEKLTIHQKVCKPGKPLGWTLWGQREVYKPPPLKTKKMQEEVKQERVLKMISTSLEQEDKPSKLNT